MARQEIDYTCPSCGAAAEKVPEPDAKPHAKTARVMVPHRRGCPVAIRIAELRAQVAGRGVR